MTIPKISVLMTAYNREKYIAEAIESVLASTFTDFELIVVDDQSHDRTVEIAQQYETQDKRVRVFVNEHNLGDYPNRNRAASLAKGIYLKYVDADDIIYPHGLQEFVRYMDQYPEAGLALSAGSQVSDRHISAVLSPHQAYADEYIHRRGWFARSPLSALIRRSAFVAVGGFSGKAQVGDFELWHMLASRFNTLIIPGWQGWYRVHPEQQSEERRMDPSVTLAYILISRDMLESSNCPLLPEEVIAALRRNTTSQARYVLRHFITQGPRVASKLQRMVGLSWSAIIHHGLARSWRG